MYTDNGKETEGFYKACPDRSTVEINQPNWGTAEMRGLGLISLGTKIFQNPPPNVSN